MIAEKERLSKAGGESTAPTTTDSIAWEKEKAELVKARDETADKLKVNHLSHKPSGDLLFIGILGFNRGST